MQTLVLIAFSRDCPTKMHRSSNSARAKPQLRSRANPKPGKRIGHTNVATNSPQMKYKYGLRATRDTLIPITEDAAAQTSRSDVDKTFISKLDLSKQAIHERTRRIRSSTSRALPCCAQKNHLPRTDQNSPTRGCKMSRRRSIRPGKVRCNPARKLHIKKTIVELSMKNGAEHAMLI
jgi:hypothetical protein